MANGDTDNKVHADSTSAAGDFARAQLEHFTVGCRVNRQTVIKPARMSKTYFVYS